MVAKLIDDVVSLLDRGRRESKIRTELEALSDEDLSCLGIKRQDIDKVAREAAQQH